jgi:hypothetical protein
MMSPAALAGPSSILVRPAWREHRAIAEHQTTTYRSLSRLMSSLRWHRLHLGLGGRLDPEPRNIQRGQEQQRQDRSNDEVLLQTLQ